jgi:NADPH:quinone reductase-like Zn-dependent oxidoreductase
MHAIRIHTFGGTDELVLEDIEQPVAGHGQVLVRVGAAGVGPWDAWVRAGQSALPQPLPLTLGSDLAGIVAAVGPGVTSFHVGDAVFGVTNAQFTGAYAQFALAEASMIAIKPLSLSDIDAASFPVVASTAWQMLFDHGKLTAGKTVLIHGAAGNVGAYAVQFAKQAGAEVIATVYARDMEYVRSLGVHRVIDVQTERFDAVVKHADVVLDTLGGETLARSFAVVKPGGVLVSSVAHPDPERARQLQINGVFFLVAVTSEELTRIAELIGSGKIRTNVGEVLPLADARVAHEMLAGKPHKNGKIVLSIGAN